MGVSGTHEPRSGSGWRVEKNGADVYDIEFEHGSTEWQIVMTSDGILDSVGFRMM